MYKQEIGQVCRQFEKLVHFIDVCCSVCNGYNYYNIENYFVLLKNLGVIKGDWLNRRQMVYI